MVLKIRYFLTFLTVFLMGHNLAFGQVFENYHPDLHVQKEQNWFAPPRVAKVEVNLDQFSYLDIAVALPSQSSLFIDGKMWFYAQKDTSFTISTEEFMELFPSAAGYREFTIYNPEIRIEDISISRGIFGEALSSIPGPEGPVISSNRNNSEMEDFFMLAVLIIFSLISLFKVIYPLVISFVIRPMFTFSTEDFFESNSLTRFFSEEILFFLLIFNMLLMLLFMVSAYFLERIGLESMWRGDLDYMFFVWLFGTGVLLLFSLMRFFWLKLSAVIFGINKIEFTHFFFMLRIASLILLAICMVIFVSLTNGVVEVKGLIGNLWTGFFVVYILGIFMLYFTMTKKVSFKNYHLFSYLCTAELVPFLVFSKMLMG